METRYLNFSAVIEINVMDTRHWRRLKNDISSTPNNTKNE